MPHHPLHDVEAVEGWGKVDWSYGEVWKLANAIHLGLYRLTSGRIGGRMGDGGWDHSPTHHNGA
jgi:hypothetical protein